MEHRPRGEDPLQLGSRGSRSRAPSVAVFSTALMRCDRGRRNKGRRENDGGRWRRMRPWWEEIGAPLACCCSRSSSAVSVLLSLASL
jgi:hypothetical protein